MTTNQSRIQTQYKWCEMYCILMDIYANSLVQFITMTTNPSTIQTQYKWCEMYCILMDIYANSLVQFTTDN